MQLSHDAHVRKTHANVPCHLHRTHDLGASTTKRKHHAEFRHVWSILKHYNYRAHFI